MEYLIQDNSLIKIGNAIRNVFNSTNVYSPQGMAEMIDSRMLGVPDPIVAGDYPIYGICTSQKIEDSSYTDLGVFRFTVNRAGTYRFKWCCMKPAIGGSSGNGTALFLNDENQYENSSFSNNVNFNEVDVECSVGDIVSIKGRHNGMYATYIFGVSVCIEWNGVNGFFTEN